jgi:hypothetical protein
MFRQCLLFVAAAAIAAGAAFVEGSTAIVGGFSRLVFALLLFLPVVAANANILRGPPPI